MNPELNKYRVKLLITYNIDGETFCDGIIKEVLAYNQDSAKIKASNDVERIISGVDLLHINVIDVKDIKPKEPLFIREGFKNEE